MFCKYESCTAKEILSISSCDTCCHVYVVLVSSTARSRTSGWSDIPLAEREEPKLESVTGIIMMSSGIEQIDEATTERLVGALALFPCVEQVSISLAIDHRRWVPFRKLLKARCPKMKSVVIGADVYQW